MLPPLLTPRFGTTTTTTTVLLLLLLLLCRGEIEVADWVVVGCRGGSIVGAGAGCGNGERVGEAAE